MQIIDSWSKDASSLSSASGGGPQARAEGEAPEQFRQLLETVIMELARCSRSSGREDACDSTRATTMVARRAATKRVVDKEHRDGANDGHEQALEVETAHSRHSMDVSEFAEGSEEPAANDGSDDTEEDVHDESLTLTIDDLAGDEARDEPEDDPHQHRHGWFLSSQLV
jgi:hypothetical protein